MIAVTPDRVLIGRRQKPKGTGDRTDFYFYCDASLNAAISIETKVEDGNGLLSDAHKIVNVIHQGDPPKEFESPWLGIVQRRSYLSTYALGLFLGSEQHAISYSDFAALANDDYDGDRKAVDTDFGVMSVSLQSGGVSEFSLVQGPDDLRTLASPGLHLRDARTQDFPSGFQEIRQVCRFDPPLQQTLQAPWRMTCSYSKEGFGGQKTTQIRVFDVEKSSTSASEVDAIIDKVLGWIPIGQRVVSEDFIHKEWSAGEIVAATDLEALSAAESVRFKKSSGTHRLLFVLNAVAIVSVAAYFIYIRRKEGSR